MDYPELHIIHLPTRRDRLASLQEQLCGQGITSFKLWDGIVNTVNPATGISQAHKQVVRFARDNRYPFILVAEDDICFTAPGAFRYFRENQPPEFDLYLGTISYGKIDANGVVKDFSGLLLYMVHERFYETFLSVPETGHLDRSLQRRGLFKVCPRFVATEIDGKSDNTGWETENSRWFAGRPLFGREPISLS